MQALSKIVLNKDATSVKKGAESDMSLRKALLNSAPLYQLCGNLISFLSMRCFYIGSNQFVAFAVYVDNFD